MSDFVVSWWFDINAILHYFCFFIVSYFFPLFLRVKLSCDSATVSLWIFVHKRSPGSALDCSAKLLWVTHWLLDKHLNSGISVPWLSLIVARHWPLRSTLLTSLSLPHALQDPTKGCCIIRSGSRKHDQGLHNNQPTLSNQHQNQWFHTPCKHYKKINWSTHT